MLLPIIGAGLGGLEAYRRTGGDIGATLLGAGLGAAVPGGLRMAGTALGETALGARLLGGIPQAASKVGGALGASPLGQAAMKAGVTLPQGPLPAMTAAGLGGLAAGIGTTMLGAPALAGGLAAKATQPLRAAAQVGAGTAGYQAPGQVDYEALSGGAVPPVGTFGAGGTLSDPLNVLGRVGMAQRLETIKDAETQRDAMRLLMPEVMRAAEASKKAEFQRQLAAAGVRQNILTAANMLERSQQAAQQMGLTAAQQAGSALTSQYQYS